MDESNTANWLSECGMWIVLPIVLASALLGVLLGDYKGRSADGFMLGLLLGPAGLIFLYYLKPKSLKSFSNEGSDSHSNTKRQHRSDDATTSSFILNLRGDLVVPQVSVGGGNYARGV